MSAADSSATQINELHFRSWERDLRSRNRSDLTIKTYRQAFNHLIARFPDRDVAELTPQEIKTHIAASLVELRDTTVETRYCILRAFYNWAVGEDIISQSPMAKMTKPKIQDVPPPILPDEHLKALLAACDGKSFLDRRDTAIIRLWCEPGSPRVAEMVGIRMRDDLDMARDMVRLHGKGDKVRFIPFGTKTGQAIDRYLRLRSRHRAADSPMLWLSQRGGPITVAGLGNMLSKRARQAGIGHIHPHQLRHTAAHNWADSGGSEGDAMELFGWTSSQMPRRYGRSASTARAHRAARRASLGDRL